MQKNDPLHVRSQHFSDRPSGEHLAEQLSSGCCNAKTRKGTPCQIRTIYKNGRCKLHGGLSTGPKTKKGKAASRLNGKKGGRSKLNRQEST